MSARERLQRFIDAWPISNAHPDDIHQLWVNKEDEPRVLRKSDIETVLLDRPASNTERPVWIEALKAVSREWREAGDTEHADYLDGIREQVTDVLESGDRLRPRDKTEGAPT